MNCPRCQRGDTCVESTTSLDLSGPPVALNEACVGPSCQHPSHAVGAPDEVDALRDERDRLRERLDQFEAYGYPTVASVLDRVAGLERAYEDDVETLQHVFCAFAFGLGLDSMAKCVWCGHRAKEDSEEMRTHRCSGDPTVAALANAERQRDECAALAAKRGKRVEEVEGWLEMYASAWARELGGQLVPKTHRIDSLVATTERLRRRCEALGAALQSLLDEQNGAPLLRRKREWEAAVDAARAALEGTS